MSFPTNNTVTKEQLLLEAVRQNPSIWTKPADEFQCVLDNIEKFMSWRNDEKENS